MAVLLIAVAVLAGLVAGVALIKRSRRRACVEPAATPGQLAALALQLCGPERVAHDPLDDMGDGVTVRQAAWLLVAAEAHREAVQAGRAGLLAGSAVAEEILPPGTRSPDGSAIVGTAGRLYIARGANDFVRQYQGETPLSPEGVRDWAARLDRSRDRAAALGVPLACLVVPDKLAIDPDGYPELLAPDAGRPVQQLLVARRGALLYPLEQLRRGQLQEPVSLQTDSHLTAHGAQIVHDVVVRKLGLRRAADRSRRPRSAYLMSGDLGVKFTPAIHEIASAPASSPELSLAEDNAAEILALGGHLGVRRVARNDAPVVDARLVVFGDSYSYIQPSSAGNLGELLARTFREVHFLWAPFCWDEGYLGRHRPDYVLLQMAERFAITVPRETVDVEALAVETLRRKGGVVPEEITDSAVAVAERSRAPSQ